MSPRLGGPAKRTYGSNVVAAGSCCAPGLKRSHSSAIRRAASGSGLLESNRCAVGLALIVKDFPALKDASWSSTGCPAQRLSTILRAVPGHIVPFVTRLADLGL